MYTRFKAPQEPRFMTAKRASVCPETKKPINVGDRIAWYPKTGTAFHDESKAASELRSLQFSQAHGMADANY